MGWSGASDVVVELKITIFGILDFSSDGDGGGGDVPTTLPIW